MEITYKRQNGSLFIVGDSNDPGNTSDESHDVGDSEVSSTVNSYPNLSSLEVERADLKNLDGIGSRENLRDGKFDSSDFLNVTKKFLTDNKWQSLDIKGVTAFDTSGLYDLLQKNTLSKLAIKFAHKNMAVGNTKDEWFSTSDQRELFNSIVESLRSSLLSNISLTEFSCDQDELQEEIHVDVTKLLERNKNIQQLFNDLGKKELEGDVDGQNKIKVDLLEYLYRHPKVEGSGRELLLTKIVGADPKKHRVVSQLAGQMDTICNLLAVGGGNFLGESGVEKWDVPLSSSTTKAFSKESVITTKGIIDQLFSMHQNMQPFESFVRVSLEDLEREAYFRLKAFDKVDDKECQQILVSGKFEVVPNFVQFGFGADGLDDNPVVLNEEETIAFSEKLLDLSNSTSQALT